MSDSYLTPQGLLSDICTEVTFLPSHMLLQAMLQFNKYVKFMKLT